jgi:hypothetical protein
MLQPRRNWVGGSHGTTQALGGVAWRNLVRATVCAQMGAMPGSKRRPRRRNRVGMGRPTPREAVRRQRPDGRYDGLTTG